MPNFADWRPVDALPEAGESQHGRTVLLRGTPDRAYVCRQTAEGFEWYEMVAEEPLATGTGPQGPEGPPGADSTVSGPPGEDGAPGLPGLPGSDADVTAHEAASNPHPAYATDVDLTTHAATPHGGDHPDLATHDSLGLATQAELNAHAHSGVYEPVHSHPYAATGHTHAGGSGPNMLKKTANQTINGGAGVFVDIADLTFPVVSGTDYAFDFYITFQSAAATTGWRAGVNCPTGTLDFWAGSDIIANGAAGVATHTERHNTVRDDMTLLTATITQAVDLNVRIRGRYLCTANGTFAARFANELAANTQIVVQRGSWGLWF